MKCLCTVQANVRNYYMQFEESQTQSLIDSKIMEFEARTRNAFQAQVHFTDCADIPSQKLASSALAAACPMCQDQGKSTCLQSMSRRATTTNSDKRRMCTGGGIVPGADDGQGGRTAAHGGADAGCTWWHATAADGPPNDGHAAPWQAPHGPPAAGLPR